MAQCSSRCWEMIQRQGHGFMPPQPKGGHIRTVPVPDWGRAERDDWLVAAAIDRGRLFGKIPSDIGSDGIYPRYGIACRIEEISGDEILVNQGIIYASLVRLRSMGGFQRSGAI